MADAHALIKKTTWSCQPKSQVAPSKASTFPKTWLYSWWQRISLNHPLSLTVHEQTEEQTHALHSIIINTCELLRNHILEIITFISDKRCVLELTIICGRKNLTVIYLLYLAAKQSLYISISVQNVAGYSL